MKKLFIIANWKSYKNSDDSYNWLKLFLESAANSNFGTKETIVCPPYTALPQFHNWITNHKLSLGLGAQDVSPFDEGAYTGEVNAKQVKEFADYVIIGHSERRKYFSESDELLSEKVQQALSFNLKPIFCVQGEETQIPKGVFIVAYEPVFAIGSGTPDTPENAEKVIKTIKEKNGVEYVVYGGSVTGENVNSFTSQKSIDGVLVGGASLDPEKFIHIISNS